MSRKHVKQYVMLLLAVGVIAVALSGGGTFASFTAETANPGNTFTTGTLYLHDRVANNGNDTCTSESTNNNSNVANGSHVNLGDTCDTLITVPNGASTAVVAHLALKDAGTLDASGIKVALQTACAESNVYEANTTLSADANTADTSITVNPTTLYIRSGTLIQISDGTNTETKTVSGNVAFGATTINLTTGLAHSYLAATPTNVNSSPQFSGGGTLCANIGFSVSETDSSFTGTVNANTGNVTALPAGYACVYGTQGGGGNDGCTGDVTNFNIAGLPTDPTFTALSPLKSGGGTGNTATKLSSQGTRYFLVVFLPSLTNSNQGKTTIFDIVWHIDQA